MADDVDLLYKLLKREKDDLNYVYEMLKCQNHDCVNYLIPPTLQCVIGHSFCSYCIWKETCPLCSGGIIKTKCRTLNHIVNALLLGCKNKDVGCNEVFPPYIRDEHEAQCIYNYTKCIHSGCTWRGERVILWRHLVETHPQDMVQNNQLRFSVPLNQQFIMHRIFKYQDTHFTLKCIFDTFSDKIYGAVRQVDDKYRLGTSYTFTLPATRKRGQLLYRYMRETHESHKRFGYIFKSEDCFVMSREFVIEFYMHERNSIHLNLLIQVASFQPFDFNDTHNPMKVPTTNQPLTPPPTPATLSNQPSNVTPQIASPTATTHTLSNQPSNVTPTTPSRPHSSPPTPTAPTNPPSTPTTHANPPSPTTPSNPPPTPPPTETPSSNSPLKKLKNFQLRHY